MNLSLDVDEKPEETFKIPEPQMQLPKPGLKIGLDIDDINKLYTYGGEQGSRLDEGKNELETFEENIRELALKCLSSICRETPNDPIVEGKQFQLDGW